MLPHAYFNGRLVHADELRIPPTDAGFVLGITVAEQMRTFGGRLFRLDEHLARLARSLEIVGIEPPSPLTELGRVAEELASRNHVLLAPGDDLGLSCFLTPGPYATFVPEGGPPTVGIHAYPVPFGFWAGKYRTGESLAIVSVRQVPANCWPAELKCRSRMHYHLADREARRLVPGARAILLDQDGFLSEASTANILLYRRAEGIVSPPRRRILPGVSLAVNEELATELGLPWVERDVAVADLQTADELWLTSTSPCLLPATTLDGRPVGDGRPGPVFARMLAAWSARVGLDVAAQAERFARRG